METIEDMLGYICVTQWMINIILIFCFASIIKLLKEIKQKQVDTKIIVDGIREDLEEIRGEKK